MNSEIIATEKTAEAVEKLDDKTESAEGHLEHDTPRFKENRESLLREARSTIDEGDSQDNRRQLDEHDNSFLSEVSEYKETIIKNKLDGLEREKSVEKALTDKYPESEGYSVESEKPLRDENGGISKDPETGEYRRLDFVVIKDGMVVDSVEVTSKTADKTEQTAKEERIRNNGGNYIKTYAGILVRIPDDVRTRIERRN